MSSTDPGDEPLGNTDADSHEEATGDGTLQLADANHAILRRFRLRVTGGPDVGAKFESNAERSVVGTHASADLLLHDPTVSRFHVELTPLAGRVLIRDLGSRNGTLVDGVSVIAAHARPGSKLSLGRTELQFELCDEPGRVPLAARESFGVVVGRSLAMRRVFAMLERAASSDATVLLEGETGTGKEAVAESIHRESARKDGPLVIVDCGAIPGDLLESELFGHERGAFTGAVAQRRGAFEAASGGTIFLDEIGELGAELQPKLLRVLEKKHIKRVGTNQYVPVDVRVLAATNRNLRAQVNAKTFRSDLYYRLAVLEIRLPPLRERMDDLPLLVEHLLGVLGARERPEAAALRTPEFIATLARHGWEGNVRELRNYLERCLALREEAPLPSASASDADGAGGDGGALDLTQPIKAARDECVRRFERRYVEEMLARHAGSVVPAARAAGVDRTTFYRLMWRAGIR